jgi:hypothetical protein
MRNALPVSWFIGGMCCEYCHGLEILFGRYRAEHPVAASGPGPPALISWPTGIPVAWRGKELGEKLH